jgi:hypothetical protein
MARSDTRYSVYPAPKAVEVLGATAPALNQALECWAALLARAMADNSRQFEQADRVISNMLGKLCQMNEWSLMAEALKGVRFDPDFGNPGYLLAAAVEDAHRLEYIGADSLDWGEHDSTVIKDKHIDAAVTAVVEKLSRLDYVHAWAVIVAVQWFSEHHDDGIDVKNDLWWTPGFRRRWQGKQTGIKEGATTTKRQREGKRGNRKMPPKQ